MTTTMRAGAVERWKFLTESAGGQGSDTAQITITTPSVDHYNDRVLPEGIDRSAFDRNPTVLWAHDAYGVTEAAGIPIGKATALAVSRSGITATWRWLQGDAFVARVKNAWDQGIINAASVGFIPLQVEPNDQGGYDISRWKLLEFSLVPIPANPEAVRKLKALGLTSRRLPLDLAQLVRSELRAYLGRELRPRLDLRLAREAIQECLVDHGVSNIEQAVRVAFRRALR
jgi:HK97 family phage prohead protease